MSEKAAVFFGGCEEAGLAHAFVDYRDYLRDGSFTAWTACKRCGKRP